ncbi:MAG: hypothetical protein QG650_1099, partial [Patescibacteria group bacterium]|nr:hypothetical protein [Patescibacteria group bacterium]
MPEILSGAPKAAETLLAKLRTKAETAVSDEERR